MKNPSMGIVPLRPSIRYMLICTAPWLMLFYGLLLAAFLVSPFALVLCWLSLLAFFYHLFWLCAECYVMSPDLVIVNKGLLQKTVTCLPLLQVKDYRVHQSLLMSYLNIVTLSFVTKDDQQLLIKLKGIDRFVLQRAYRDIIDQLENRQAVCKYLLELFGKLTPDQ